MCPDRWVIVWVHTPEQSTTLEVGPMPYSSGVQDLATTVPCFPHVSIGTCDAHYHEKINGPAWRNGLDHRRPQRALVRPKCLNTFNFIPVWFWSADTMRNKTSEQILATPINYLLQCYLNNVCYPVKNIWLVTLKQSLPVAH